MLNNDLTKKCIKMFHKNWVSQEGFFYTNWTIIWICKATRTFPYKHAQYNYCESMVAIKRFNLMMARDLCLTTGFRFKYFVSCRMVVMSICILILLWFLAPSKWYSTRPIGSFFDERLMKFTSGSWVNRVPTLLTIVLKTRQNIFSCYIMKTIIL